MRDVDFSKRDLNLEYNKLSPFIAISFNFIIVYNCWITNNYLSLLFRFSLNKDSSIDFFNYSKYIVFIYKKLIETVKMIYERDILIYIYYKLLKRIFEYLCYNEIFS